VPFHLVGKHTAHAVKFTAAEFLAWDHSLARLQVRTSPSTFTIKINLAAAECSCALDLCALAVCKSMLTRGIQRPAGKLLGYMSSAFDL
jgi:hypothetical protein